MQTKLITCRRILNLGNYESRHLEIQAEVLEGEDSQQEVRHLMEQVERQIREPETSKILEDIRELKDEVKRLQREKSALEQACKSLPKTPELSSDEEPDPDDIPFEGAGAATSSDPADF